ncbi:MAG: ABC transporter ATP-binding protein [Candidatus Saccharimonadales bacterium]|nr:ABC transporter ATP-binding protein [Candidatus Saccharimonadales bacterium]
MLGINAPKTAATTISIYWKHTLKYKRALIICMAMMPIVVLAGAVLTPLVYATAIDRLFEGGSTLQFSDFVGLIWVYALLNFIIWAGWRVIGFTMINLQPRVMRDLDYRIYDWLQRQSYGFHVNSFAGSLVAKTNRFVRSYERLFDSLYFPFHILLWRLVFTIIALLFVAPPLALVLFLWAILFSALVSWLTSRKYPAAKAAAAADSKVTARLADNLTNMLNIKTFGHEKYEQAEFNSVAEFRRKKVHRDWYLNEWVFTTQASLFLILDTIILLVSINFVLNGTMSIAVLALLQFFLIPLYRNFMELNRVFRNIERSLADAEEMTRILGMEPEVVDAPEATELAISEGTIDFKNVRFRYTDDKAGSEHLFNKFSLNITPGERIGLVGPSGGGKSTLTKLLLRFMDIEKGSIKIDGQDIAKVTQESLRQGVSYVPQEPVLFHRTLEENIAYGNLDAAHEQIVDASRRARAHRFIDKLPNGYKTLVGERGIKLSGGERQRVAIARAILKDAPVLVLDEATSSLDSESEKLIQEALEELMEGRTSIVIAHRLSTIQRMDRIVVLDDGQIIEAGSHQQLLAKKGLYSELWKHQSGGFLEE